MARHPQQITTADTALDDDMKSRIIKYSITMTIRTLCFVFAYVAFASSHPVLMWIFVAGAVLLPYPAVIFANAGRERSRNDSTAIIDSAPLDQLPAGRGETTSGDSPDGQTVGGQTIDGETIDDGQTGSDTTSARPTRMTVGGHHFTAASNGDVVEDDGDTGPGARR